MVGQAVPLGDLIRALPWVLLVGLLPGMAVARLLLPRCDWWTRLAAAPGLSAGLVGTVALGTHATHRVPFRAATVIPMVAAVVLAALAVELHSRRSGASSVHPSVRIPRVVLACAVGAGLITVAAAAAGFGGNALPVETDAPVHAAVAGAMIDTHDAVPIIRQPVDGSGWVRTRIAVEAQAALTEELDGPSAARVLLPLTLLAVLLLPLGIALLALEWSGSAAVAAVAPLMAIGLAFPSIPVLFGEFPYVIDATLVAPLVLVVSRALTGESVRRNSIAAGSLVLCVLVIHGTEVLTAAVVGAVPVGIALLRRRGLVLPAAGAVLAAGAAAAAAGWVLTRAPVVPAPTTGATARGVDAETTSFASLLGHVAPGDAATVFLQFLFPNVAALALAAVGLFAVLRTGRLRWVGLASIAVLLLFLDVLSDERTSALWLALRPWSGQDRVPALEYWLAPVVMAAGVVEAWRWAVPRLDSMSTSMRRLAPMLAAALAVPLLVAGFGHDLGLYQAAAQSKATMSVADEMAMSRLASILPAGTVVLTDGIVDGGQWLGALTPLVPYYSDTYMKAHPSDPRIQALARACDDPVSAAQWLGGVGVIYVGATQRAGQEGAWSAACIARIPGVHLIVDVTESGRRAVAFGVDRPGI